MGNQFVRVLTVCVATVTIFCATGCGTEPNSSERAPSSVTSSQPATPEEESMPDYDRLEVLAQMNVEDPVLMDLARNQLELEAMWPSDDAETGAIAYAPFGDLCYLAFIGTGTLTPDRDDVYAELRWRYADDVPLVVTGTGTPLDVVSAAASADDTDIALCFYGADVQTDAIEV